MTSSSVWPLWWLVTLVLGTAPVQSSPVQIGLSVTRTELDIAVDYDTPALSGDARLTVQNGGDGPADSVPLLLNRLMRFTAARAAEGNVALTWVTDDVVVFSDDVMRQARFGRLKLPAPLAPGARTTVIVSFAGPLVGYTEIGWLYVRDKIDPAFTIIRADALAFPTIGVPSSAVNRAAPRPPFAFRAAVTVPRPQVVAAGGRPVATTDVDASRRRFEFAGEAVPFLNIAIAPFEVRRQGAITVYALPGDVEGARVVDEAATRALDTLARWRGPLREAPAVTVIEIPQGFGSQASLTGGIILDAAAFARRDALPQLYHEVSHIWDPPDADVPSPRWNEGLAMYMQYRLARELDGFSATGAALDRTRSALCGVEALTRTPFAAFGREALTDQSYRLGLLLFTAIERAAGAAVLDEGLRAYRRTHESGGTTRDLASSLDHAAGGSLTRLLDDWLFTTRWRDPVCSAATTDEALAHWTTRHP